MNEAGIMPGMCKGPRQAGTFPESDQVSADLLWSELKMFEIQIKFDFNICPVIV